MKHIIQLCPVNWVKQMAKMNEMVGMKNCIMIYGGKKRLVCPFTKAISMEMYCLHSIGSYGNKGHNICSEVPRTVGNTWYRYWMSNDVVVIFPHHQGLN